jgi:hypothetical protein
MSQEQSPDARIRNWMAFGFSAVAVLLSLLSAYFTFLQGPRISVVPGEVVTLGNLAAILSFESP